VLAGASAAAVALPAEASAFWFQSRLFGGKFRCTSRISGLRCQNRSGHGWFLSVQKQSIF
jgi:hypothetical protein